MPRRLTIDSEVEAQAKDWVRSLIRSEMDRQKLTYRDLAERLALVGLQENERNIANKVARGELSAVTFLLCLKVMGCDTLPLEDHSFAGALRVFDKSVTVDQVLQSDLVTVVERDDDAGMYRIRVGTITTPITILLVRLDSRVRPTLSHVIEPPGRREIGVHLPGVFGSPALALSRIVRMLVSAYENGICAGRTPDETWVVPVNALSKRGDRPKTGNAQ